MTPSLRLIEKSGISIEITGAGHNTAGRRRFEVTVDDTPWMLGTICSVSVPPDFEFGYSGLGSAQLAMARLAHAFDDNLAKRYYQHFKQEIMSNLSKEVWTLTNQDFAGWWEVSTDGKA